jgi:hypothetical protein
MTKIEELSSPVAKLKATAETFAGSSNITGHIAFAQQAGQERG